MQDVPNPEQIPVVPPDRDDRILELLSRTNLVNYALELGPRGGSVPHDEAGKEQLESALALLAEQGPVMPGERDPRIRGILERTGMGAYITAAGRRRKERPVFPAREARLAVLNSLAESFGLQEPEPAVQPEEPARPPRKRVVRWLRPPAEIAAARVVEPEPEPAPAPRKTQKTKTNEREQLANQALLDLGILLSLEGLPFEPDEIYTLHHHLLGQKVDTGSELFRRPARYLERALRVSMQRDRRARNNGMAVRQPLTQLDWQLMRSLLGDYYDFSRKPSSVAEVAKERAAKNPGGKQSKDELLSEICSVLHRAAAHWPKHMKLIG